MNIFENIYLLNQSPSILLNPAAKIEPRIFGKIAKNKMHARVMHNIQYILALTAGPTIWLNIFRGLILNSNLPSGCGSYGE